MALPMTAATACAFGEDIINPSKQCFRSSESSMDQTSADLKRERNLLSLLIHFRLREINLSS
jgi:hypothetical protein